MLPGLSQPGAPDVFLIYLYFPLMYVETVFLEEVHGLEGQTGLWAKMVKNPELSSPPRGSKLCAELLSSLKI